MQRQEALQPKIVWNGQNYTPTQELGCTSGCSLDTASPAVVLLLSFIQHFSSVEGPCRSWQLFFDMSHVIIYGQLCPNLQN